MNVVEYNSKAWDGYAEAGNLWSIPVTPEEIAQARQDDWKIVLTPVKPVPRAWFGTVPGKDILCLASGGGQQAPILAAAGARVTSFDASPAQLARDRMVAERENLTIRIEQGDAADLSRFADESFDLIFHPCSNCFIEKLEPVWMECHRVLRPGGVLLAGFNQPFIYMYDDEAEVKEGILKLAHKLPWSDLESLSEAERQRKIEQKQAFEFSHSLDAGFLISGFYEDGWSDEARLLNRYTPTFIATRALKL
jgi:SAM-dependent methyltransferase